MTDRIAYLIPRSPVVPPMVLELPDGPVPDQLRRNSDEYDLPPTVYRLALLVPPDAAVYVVDDLATGRLAAGIPDDVPVHRGATSCRCGRDPHVGPCAAPGERQHVPGSVLDLPAGRARRDRERAVLDEDDARWRMLAAEREPDVATLTRERNTRR